MTSFATAPLSGHAAELLALLQLTAPMADQLDRIFQLRPGWHEAIDQLRTLGLVETTSLLPSPSTAQAVEEPASRALSARPARLSRWDSEELQDRLVAAIAETHSVRGALIALDLRPDSAKELNRARKRLPAFDARCTEALGTAGPRPLTQASAVQRSAADFDFTFRKHVSEPPRSRPSDAEISAAKLRHLEERKRIEQLERAPRLLSIDEAKRVVMRKMPVYRASLIGGADDRWVVGSRKDVTDEQLVAEARRMMA